jgi:glucose/arabinose dehydrogenase
LSAIRRISVALFCIGFFLTVLLQPIGIAKPQEVPIEPLPPGVVIETVVPNAHQLVDMDFTPDGRLLYTERTGNLQVVANGQAPVTARSFPVLTDGERGLLGVAVDPGFVTNHFVWLYFTKQTSETDCGGTIKNRVVRVVLNDDNSIPLDPETAGCFPVYQPAPGYYVTIHNGGSLHFGPDGKLYISVGNSNESITDPHEPAQNLGSPLGKIHRYNPAIPLFYNVPADNPFVNWSGADISNYAYGLRNPFDFTFDPVSGQMFATENGDKCDDEINLIRPGYDYGWRVNYPQTPLPCDDDVGPDPRYNTIPPLYHWTPSIAPTGITFYTGDLIPEWKNDLFMCAFKDGSTGLHHFKLNAARTAIVSHTILSDTVTHQPIQCRTDVLTGPDGALYYSEGGGYYDGPIKRISRTTSFTSSTVSVDPAAVRTDDVFTYTIQVSHVGTLSNTFDLSAVPSPSTTVEALSPGMQQYLGVISWSGLLTGIQSITGTITVRATDPQTTPYLITIPIDIAAPNLPDVNLTATTLVNGLPIFLPLIRR